MELWKIEWQDVAEKDRPNTAASALKACDKRRFLNVKRLLRILFTLPLTSAECERTFSCMRRLKSYLRSTMNAERFNGLALPATHRSEDINLINVRRRFIKVFVSLYYDHTIFYPMKNISRTSELPVRLCENRRFPL